MGSLPIRPIIKERNSDTGFLMGRKSEAYLPNLLNNLNYHRLLASTSVTEILLSRRLAHPHSALLHQA